MTQIILVCTVLHDLTRNFVCRFVHISKSSFRKKKTKLDLLYMYKRLKRRISWRIDIPKKIVVKTILQFYNN